MIVYKLSEFAKNPNLSPRLRKAVDFLLQPKTATLPDGTYQIEGKKIYAQIKTYITRQPQKILFEAHRKYIDIQYVSRGKECVHCLNIEDIDIVRPYDEKFDICFGLAKMQAYITLNLEAGDMAIFFPEHAHAPKLPADICQEVRKIVVKVAVS